MTDIFAFYTQHQLTSHQQQEERRYIQATSTRTAESMHDRTSLFILQSVSFPQPTTSSSASLSAPGTDREKSTQREGRTIIPRPEAPADYHRQLRYVRTRDGPHHLAAVFRDAALFGLGAHHVSCGQMGDGISGETSGREKEQGKE
jgi:hypothetical protein